MVGVGGWREMKCFCVCNDDDDDDARFVWGRMGAAAVEDRRE